MTDLFTEPDDATPLSPEEREGLKQSWVTTRADLNAAEQDNIDKAAAWAYRRSSVDVVDVGFSLELHRRMFNDVWNWAGTYRTTEKNIGIAPYLVGVETARMFDDAAYWIAHATYGPDETAVRLHHRLVFIHPFPNGNGRHARLLADLVVRRLGGSAFSWGAGKITDMSAVRQDYISALRKADQHDYGPLLQFARS